MPQQELGGNDDEDDGNDDEIDITQYLAQMEGINEVSPPEFSSSDETVAAENDEYPQPDENLPQGANSGNDRADAPRGRGAGAMRSPLRLFGEETTRELRRLAPHNLPGLREEPPRGRRRPRAFYRGTEEEESADS